VNEEEVLLEINFQIIEEIRSLHSKNLIHREIKPANFLKCKDVTVKIADFGLARLIPKTPVSKTKNPGTQEFMGSEMIDGDGRK
jgi:serine/threonine protein kinase